MCHLIRFLKDDNGSAAVMVALALVALIGFSALVVDVGFLFMTRAKLMDTSDAAALAGAQELPASTAAQAAAGEYVNKNGLDTGKFSFDPDGKTITVSAASTVQFLFAKVLGISEGEVRASATARRESVTSTSGVAPIGVEDQELSKGTLYTLKVGAPPTLGAGNFGALTLGQPGANQYRENIENGYAGILKIGDIIETETGNISGPTAQGIDFRLSGCPHVPQCTISDHKRDCPRTIIVPVYQPQDVEENQIKKVKIVGFAAFLIDGETSNGTDCYIRGYFIDQVIVGNSDPNQDDYGASAVRLIQ